MTELQDEREDMEPDVADGADTDIPEERAIRQSEVTFWGDALAAALTETGAVYISLPGMCGALGLNVKGQMQRIKRTRSLAKGLRLIQLASQQRGMHPTNCLRVDKIALWLAGVQTATIKPGFREKIEAYQDDLAPIATQVFLQAAGVRLVDVVPANEPTLLSLAQQIENLTDISTFLREHFTALLGTMGQLSQLPEQMTRLIGLLEATNQRQDLSESKLAKIDERTQHLTPAHEREIQLYVDRMVRATEKFPSPLTYYIIYGRLKTRFRVGSYKELADERFDEVLQFLRDELRKAGQSDLPEQGKLF